MHVGDELYLTGLSSCIHQCSHQRVTRVTCEAFCIYVHLSNICYAAAAYRG